MQPIPVDLNGYIKETLKSVYDENTLDIKI